MTRRRTLAHSVPAGETDLPIQFHGMHAPAVPTRRLDGFHGLSERDRTVIAPGKLWKGGFDDLKSLKPFIVTQRVQLLPGKGPARQPEPSVAWRSATRVAKRTQGVSGDTQRDQGISRNGPAWIRAQLIQVAWRWLRYQPDSALSKWFNERTAGSRGRIRRVMIVALARKLLIALRRFSETGLVPTGAKFA